MMCLVIVCRRHRASWNVHLKTVHTTRVRVALTACGVSLQYAVCVQCNIHTHTYTHEQVHVYQISVGMFACIYGWMFEYIHVSVFCEGVWFVCYEIL